MKGGEEVKKPLVGVVVLIVLALFIVPVQGKRPIARAHYMIAQDPAQTISLKVLNPKIKVRQVLMASNTGSSLEKLINPRAKARIYYAVNGKQSLIRSGMQRARDAKHLEYQPQPDHHSLLQRPRSGSK